MDRQRRSRERTPGGVGATGPKKTTTTKALPKKATSLDSVRKTATKTTATNAKSVKPLSGGLPGRSLSNGSDKAAPATAPVTPGRSIKKGVFGSMRNLIKSPKKAAAKEKVTVPAEEMMTDIM